MASVPDVPSVPEVTEERVEITTADGVCPAALCVPKGAGPFPAVVLYPDAGGAREALFAMGARLSSLGYVVLVPDVYYRKRPWGPIDMKTVWSTPKSAAKAFALMRSCTVERVVRDAAAFCDYLEGLEETRATALGTTGYCMGGRLSLVVASHLGARIKAAASFHGGNLADPSDPDSPHHRAKEITAHLYVAGATADSSFPAAQKALLERSLADAGVPHLVETYPARHGFCVTDNAKYDQAAAERHWQATEAFFRSVFAAA